MCPPPGSATPCSLSHEKARQRVQATPPVQPETWCGGQPLSGTYPASSPMEQLDVCCEIPGWELEGSGREQGA